MALVLLAHVQPVQARRAEPVAIGEELRRGAEADLDLADLVEEAVAGR